MSADSPPAAEKSLSRVWSSMSWDGLTPRNFARNHPTRQVPTRMIWPNGVAFPTWLISNPERVTWVRFTVLMVIRLLFYRWYGFHHWERNPPRDTEGATW